MVNHRFIGIVAGAVASLLAAHANAALFYGVTNNGAINRIDTAAQTVTTLSVIHVGPVVPGGFDDLEFDAGGNLFAVRNYSNTQTFEQVSQGYRILDPMTGNSLLSSTLGTFGIPYTSLAATSTPGSFRTVYNINGNVGTVNINTGVFAPVSGVPHGSRWFVDAMAVNPVDGQAYGLVDLGVSIFGQIDYNLIRFDLDTGLSTVVGSLGAAQNQFRSLRFDDLGTLYTVNSTNGDICAIDTMTGHVSSLFAGGAATMNTTGLAFIQVPGPGAAAAFCLGGLMIGARRRR